MQVKNITLDVFSRRLALMKDQRRTTQVQIAEVAGVSQSAVVKWLKGATSPGSVELFRLATFFAVPMEWLLGVEHSPEEAQRQIESRWKIKNESENQKYAALRSAIEDALKKF